MSGTITRRQSGPMGHILWNTTRGDYMWSGPGSRLLMAWGGSLISIDHPTASGTYDRESDARAALTRFLALFDDDDDADGES